MLLNTQNLLDYLSQIKLLNSIDSQNIQVKILPAKNFNLLVTLSSDAKILVKQEREKQKLVVNFQNEWLIQNFLQEFPELTYMSSLLPHLLHYDPDNSIIIFRYLEDYQDLSDFYIKKNIFPVEIANLIGKAVANLHKSTFNQQRYQEFWQKNGKTISGNYVEYLTNKLAIIEPEIFGMVTTDVIKFLALYQRYASFGETLNELATAFKPCCLTHQDLKLNNILINQDWQNHDLESHLKFIDWERAKWGDPAFDLGTLIGSYLLLWLNNLVISKGISIEESLKLARISLEKLQPSLASLMFSYLDTFPEVNQYYPHFLERVIQFAGFGLIQQIMAALKNKASLGNMGIILLQVSKTLLCNPNASVSTVFGKATSQLMQQVSV